MTLIPARPREAGFTLVEVTVALAILLVGVLGTVSLVDGAGQATSDNRAREGATNLSREILEVVRSVRYSELTESGIRGALGGRASLADSSTAAGYTIGRRGTTYTITVSACSTDDPKDGLGAHPSTVAFCADSTTTGTRDRNADDYRRVAITVAWSAGGREKRSRQNTVVTNPAGGLGPTVTGLVQTSPSQSPITSPSDIASASFGVTTSRTPATVRWSINGNQQGTATGSGTSWSFTWPLVKADGVTPAFQDGTYLVQAQAFDEEGRSGAVRSLTVVLNRSTPLSPSGFAGGRNGKGSDVDLEWHASGEGDVFRYRVYRSDASGARGDRACPPAADGAGAFLERTTACVDQGASGTSHYIAVALDLDPNGNLREGAATSPLSTPGGNSAPSTPGSLSICSGGSAGCNASDGTPAPSGTTVLSWAQSSDPDAGDSVQFYRLYRDGTGYGSRYDRLYAGGSTLTWIDSNTAGASHSYSVSAVDGGFAESALAGPVTK